MAPPNPMIARPSLIRGEPIDRPHIGHGLLNACPAQMAGMSGEPSVQYLGANLIRYALKTVSMRAKFQRPGNVASAKVLGHGLAKICSRIEHNRRA